MKQGDEDQPAEVEHHMLLFFSGKLAFSESQFAVL